MFRLKKVRKSICFLSFIMILFTCTVHSDEEQNSQITWTREEVIIPFGEELLDPMFASPSVFSRDKEEFLYGFDVQQNRSQVFNLSKRCFSYFITWEKEGPEAIETGPSFLIGENKDTIVFSGSRDIYLINHQGKKLSQYGHPYPGHSRDRLSAKPIQNLDDQKDGLYPTGSSLYNSFNHLTYQWLPQRYVAPDKPEYYDAPVFASVDLHQGKVVEYLPIIYPQEFKMKDFAYDAFSLQPSLLCAQDSLIYTFPCSSDIYIYDLDTKKSTVVKADSHFTPNRAQKIPLSKYGDYANYDKIFDFYLTFLSVHYDPYRKLYYRTHEIEKPTSSTGGNNQQTTREVYLMVFDSDFKVLAEIALGDQLISDPFVSREGLFFRLLYPPDEDHLYMVKYTFKAK